MPPAAVVGLFVLAVLVLGVPGCGGGGGTQAHAPTGREIAGCLRRLKGFENQVELRRGPKGETLWAEPVKGGPPFSVALSSHPKLLSRFARQQARLLQHVRVVNRWVAGRRVLATYVVPEGRGFNSIPVLRNGIAVKACIQ
jgi:hypothetical protein